jgi:hypothetical protein
VNWRGEYYIGCFTGESLIVWLMSKLETDEQTAFKIANQMLATELIFSFSPNVKVNFLLVF